MQQSLLLQLLWCRLPLLDLLCPLSRLRMCVLLVVRTLFWREWFLSPVVPPRMNSLFSSGVARSVTVFSARQSMQVFRATSLFCKGFDEAKVQFFITKVSGIVWTMEICLCGTKGMSTTINELQLRRLRSFLQSEP